MLGKLATFVIASFTLLFFLLYGGLGYIGYWCTVPKITRKTNQTNPSWQSNEASKLSSSVGLKVRFPRGGKCQYWQHPLTNQITGKSGPTNRRSIYQYCLHSSESPWAQEGLMVTGWTGPRWFLTRNVKSNPRSFLENKFFLFWGAQNNFLSP